MHALFSTGSSILVGVFRCLVELDPNNGADGNPQSLLAIILSILMNRSHLARVCREWSEWLSTIQILSLASLHFNAFGCRGTAAEIFARYIALKNCHWVACSRETFLCKPTIVEFLKLPWRLRVARLDIYVQRSDTFSRKMFEEEVAHVQNFVSPQTVALMESAIAELSASTSIPIRWPPASRRHSQTAYMRYALLNLRWKRQREVIPDEFVAWFRDVEVSPWRNMHPMHGSCWVVQAMVQLSSMLRVPSQIDHEVKGTCMFNFRNQSFGASFGAVMRVVLGSRLDLTFDFVTIPPSSVDV